MEELVWALIPIIAIICVIGLPVWSGHQRKMMELKLMQGNVEDAGLVAEIKALREQMAELRDTTTRYDMSFDAALQRIESRVGHLEGQVRSIEASETRQIMS
jgi:hypothetical protein